MQILLRQNDAIPAGSGPLDNVLMTSTDLILIWAASGLQSISGGPKYQKTSFINYDEEEEKRCCRDGVGAVSYLIWPGAGIVYFWLNLSCQPILFEEEA